jgi:hypothetical protein
VVCLQVGAAFARGADSSFVHARRAQAQLGPEIWSEVIRIENSNIAGRYPRTLHALVFELADILWFYTDTDGTQSLSLQRGRTAADRADLAPLLREIDPGFTWWRIVPGEAAATSATPGRRGELPNGCFIESLAALRVRRERGETIANARLLSYYVDTPAGRRGHTVLTGATDRGVEVIDPQEVEPLRIFPRELSGDALTLARALVGEVAQARWVPIDQPGAPGRFFAAGGMFGGAGPGDLTAWWL